MEKYFRYPNNYDDQRMLCVKHLFLYCNLDTHVNKVIDYKGDLEIYWKSMPEIALIKHAEHLWSFLGENNVINYYENYKIEINK